MDYLNVMRLFFPRQIAEFCSKKVTDLVNLQRISSLKPANVMERSATTYDSCSNRVQL